MKRKIRTYKREASYYDKAGDRNGTETAESLENTGTKVKVGNNRNRRMKIRRKNEANGDTGREEEEDEGMCDGKYKNDTRQRTVLSKGK